MTSFNNDTYTPSRIIGSAITGAGDEIDISEDILYLPDANLLDVLLTDQTTGAHIIWATDNYAEYGEGYDFFDEITPERITGSHNLIIQPRILKDSDVAADRTKEKAEVFTPSHIVKKMNDCIDDAWFCIEEQERVAGVDSEHVFDTALGEEVDFSFARTGTPDMDDDERKKLGWHDYVEEDRLEITCGEAPYLVSRYDATTGEPIAVMERYGILDRKLRIISENTSDVEDWLFWAKKAYQHTYGYEWQGDSILLARENMLATVLDHFYAKFSDEVEFPRETLAEIAEIISWNIWQMDGLKFVVPESCGTKVVEEESLFGFNDGAVIEECEGCARGKRDEHNGTYARVMDWETGKPVRFMDLLG